MYAIIMAIIIVVFNAAMGSGKYMFLTFLPFFPALMVAGLIGCFVIVGSKDHLWIYRKAPNGVKTYVKSVYFVNILYPVIIMLPFSIIMSFVVGLTLLEGVMVVCVTMVSIFALMAVGIGIAFIFPTFEERGGKVGILMGAFWGIGIGIWMGALLTSIIGFGSYGDTVSMLVFDLILIVASVTTGYLLLRLGIRKLSTME